MARYATSRYSPESDLSLNTLLALVQGTGTKITEVTFFYIRYSAEFLI